MRRATVVLLVLAACASEKGAGRDDEDEQRLARNADLQRDGAPAAADRQQPRAQARGELAAAANDAALQAALAAQRIGEAQRRGEAECAPLATREVPWPEERAVGRLLAGALLHTGKGPYAGAANGYVQLVGATLATGSARPALPWTFGVIDDARPAASSAMGGYVFVSTGLIRALENEAQLAALVAHEMVHVTARDAAATYQKTRHQACRIGLTGYYLTAAGAGSVPGADDFLTSSKFAKTMQKLASPGLDFGAKDPDVDAEFLRWFIARCWESSQLVGYGEDVEAEADAGAVALLASAGYDASALGAALARLDAAKHASRITKLEQLRGAGGFGFGTGGKTPQYPAGVVPP